MMLRLSSWWGVARLLGGSGLLMAVAWTGGCAPSGPRAEPRTPTVVSVSAPVEQEIVDYAVFTGNTAAVGSVEIRARVSGYLTKVAYQAGAEVKADTLLFEIDPRPYQADLDQASAQLASDQAALERATADLGRSEELIAKKALSREDYDKSVAAQKQAAAAILGSKAKVERAQLNMEFTKVTAPIAGRVERNLISVGNLVAADTTLLTNIVSTSPVYVYFDVDERTLLELQRLMRESKAAAKSLSEMAVEMSLADESGFPHRGHLESVDNSLDRDTGTLRVRAVFDNKDGTLLPGLFARVRVPVTDPYRALMVTERAIGTEQKQKYLLLVDEKNEVVLQNVDLGALHDGLRVISQGLRGGQRVIVNGLQRVRPGVTVDPKPVDMPGLAAPSQPAAPSVEKPRQN
jgi:RND family efflux transporter MFP subunit